MIKKNISLFNTASLLLSIIMLSSCSDTSVVYSNSIKEDIETSLANNKPVSTNIILSDKLSIPVSIEATSKGNGTINLNGLLLRVFDQHDDGIIYKNDYLNIEVKDINADGINELIFTGELKHTGEKEADPVHFEPITTIYSLNCETGYFVNIKNTSSYSIELINSQKKPILCPGK